MVTLMLIGIFTLTINIQQVDASEPPATEWTRTYGGANYDSAFSVVETSDGGYAIAGFTTSFGAGNYDFWLVKVAGPPAIPVGGIWVPVDKFGLLAPIFGSTFTIIVGTVAAAIYVKRRKKQQN